MRRRRILFAGFVVRMGKERLPRRVLFGEMQEGKALRVWTGKGLDGAPRGRPREVRHQVRTVARDSTE